MIQSNFFREVGHFVANNKPLCVLTLGLAVVAFSLVKLGGRVISWILHPSGSSAKTDRVSKISFSLPLSPTEKPKQIEKNSVRALQPVTDQVSEEFFSPPPPPAPTEKPKQIEPSSTIHLELDDDPSRIRALQPVLNFLSEGSFKDSIQAALDGHDMDWMIINNMSHPFVYMPNRPALQTMAHNYYKKYRILIRETVCSSRWDNRLNELIGEMEKQIEGPQYVGVIIAANDYYSHALPLIIYLGKKDPKTGSRKRQFLIADTMGNSGDLFDSVESIIKKLKGAEIYATTKPRQVDTYSCRTGAMLLLKRALIALQDSSDKELAGYLKSHGIEEVVSVKKKDEESLDYSYFSFDYLPPQFDASEQVTNKGGNLDTTFDSRDRRSNKSRKKDNPRTIGEIRKSHRKDTTFEYCFKVEGSRLKPKTVIPKGVKIGRAGNCISVSITIQREVNTHLAEKGQILCSTQIGTEHFTKMPTRW